MALKERIFEVFTSLLGKKTVEKPLERLNPPNEMVFRIARSVKEAKEKESPKNIICNGKQIPIKWDKVVLWSDANGLGYKPTHYSDKKRSEKDIKLFVAHFDVCLSTLSMWNVTKERGLSVHFGIDNDGTIYQFLDLTKIAWHAKGVNSISIGVEITNGFFPSFQKHYENSPQGPRPIVKNEVVHGVKLDDHLGFYDVQIEAYKALCEAVHNALNIPYQYPKDKEAKLLKTVVPGIEKGSFSGFIGHYNVTTQKKDPCDLPIDKVIDELKKQ